MFETVDLAPQWFSPRSLAASVLVHGAAAVLILSLRFTPAAANFSRHVQEITLIAPSPQPAPEPAPKPLVRTPRAFRLTPVRQRPAPPPLALDLPPAPVLETPRLPAAALELPRVLEPPRTMSAPQVMIKPAGFSGVETSLHRSPRATLSATGAFDAAAARQPADPRRTVSATSGFGDASIAAPPPASHKLSTPPDFVPVEIISKPRPAYTGEALRLRIEGEVLLKVVFGAAGEMHIVSILRGLGHGLDENAIAAARAIRFRPAQSDGGPVDSPAVIHILFQLAY